MTTPLFLLRCVQIGLSLSELDLLTIGVVNDMFTEKENDEYDGWHEVAGQADFDALSVKFMWACQKAHMDKRQKI